MNGKGDKRRPQSIPQNEYESNWDRIFGGIDYKALDTFWEHDCNGKSMMLVKGKQCNDCGKGE